MSSTPRQIFEIAITWTNGKSQPILVSDFQNVGITAVGTGSVSVLASKSAPTGGSTGSKQIDFTTPSTINNSYAPVAIYDETVIATNWVMALIVSGSTKLAEVDTNELSWVCIVRDSDTVDVSITVCTNQ